MIVEIRKQRQSNAMSRVTVVSSWVGTMHLDASGQHNVWVQYFSGVEGRLNFSAQNFPSHHITTTNISLGKDHFTKLLKTDRVETAMDMG